MVATGNVAIPVMVAPGRAKLVTRPRSTGARTATNTIGIVLVARFAAVDNRIAPVTITSTLRRITS
jgi:hypothetical protein